MGDNGNLSEVKRLLSTAQVEKRFNDVLGKKAPQFMASITNAVSANRMLQQCDANSVMQAAFVAASFDLPIDSNLGFAAIVPYRGNAQFQLMYKGFVQLAIRSGLYERMNNSEVYEDELVSYNPVLGEVEIVTDFSKCTQRASGEYDKIAGYYAWFRLNNGFSHELFMSKAEVENHAKKYSQSYKADIKSGKSTSMWSTDFDSMARKTVLKMLLSKWAPLTVEMQRAIQDDQKVYSADGSWTYEDGASAVAAIEDKPVDAFATVVDERPAEAKGKETAKESRQAEFAEFDRMYGDELPFK